MTLAPTPDAAVQTWDSLLSPMITPRDNPLIVATRNLPPGFSIASVPGGAWYRSWGVWGASETFFPDRDGGLRMAQAHAKAMDDYMAGANMCDAFQAVRDLREQIKAEVAACAVEMMAAE